MRETETRAPRQEGHSAPQERLPRPISGMIWFLLLGGLLLIVVLLLFTIVPALQRGTLDGKMRSEMPALPHPAAALVVEHAA